MPLRMRQICLVAHDLAATQKAFEDVLDLSVCFRDPAVGRWGLENFLSPVGFSFLEVVAPMPDKQPEETAAVQPETTGPDTIEAEPATMISGISAESGDQYALVRISANGTIQDYTYFTLTNPPRIVYDLKNLQSQFTTEQTVAVDSPLIERVRYYTHPDKVRLVVETNRDHLSAHAANPAKNGLIIAIGEDAHPAPSKAPVYLAAAGQASDMDSPQA